MGVLFLYDLMKVEVVWQGDKEAINICLTVMHPPVRYRQENAYRIVIYTPQGILVMWRRDILNEASPTEKNKMIFLPWQKV